MNDALYKILIAGDAWRTILSGLLVTDLVYHFAAMRYGVPVIVGVIFTLLHALVQSYVLTMLVGMYYGEVSETEL